MHEVAVVCAPTEWPAHWRLPDFQLHQHTALEALSADVQFDCILLVEPKSEELGELLQVLKERDRLGAVATLVAGRADSTGMHALLEKYPCDGFLDLAWPEALASAGIRIALGHVELGRNMVEIQRAVIDQARQQMSSLYELANHDGLTNLYNPRYFAELMERQHERSMRRREAYALVFIDLDDLKLLNTRYGHAGGSKALNELACTIVSSIRATDVAVRLGGDEFAVFLADCDQVQGTDFAKRLCAKLRTQRFEVDGEELSITVSCGVSSYPEDGANYSELLKHADAALHQAKTTGKDRAVGYLSASQQALPQ